MKAMERAYTLGLYEKAMPSDLTWREKLLTAKEAGFDFVEISIDETDAKLSRLDMTKEERFGTGTADAGNRRADPTCA